MANYLTDENFEYQINNAGKPVMVDFFATWCEPCSMLAPILEKIANDLKEEFILMKANVDAIPQTARKFQVERIPTIILFRNGKAISGFTGLMPEENIKNWLKNALNQQEPENIEKITKIYEDYAKNNGIRLNPDKKVVERIIKGLLENEKKYGNKYCPCRRITGDANEDAKKICPCFWHKEELEKDGKCFCGLFVK